MGKIRTAWNKGLHIYMGGKRFQKGNPPPLHKEECKCFRCSPLGRIKSPETLEKIRLANTGQIRLNIRGINSPSWKGGLPKCIDCKKQLASYSAERCRDHSTLKGEKSPAWKGGKHCNNCRIEIASYNSKWCFPCSLKLKRKGKIDWNKFIHPMLGKHHNKNTKEKISIAKKGQKLSKITKKRMSIATIKKWQKEEYRKKVLGKRPMSGLEIKVQKIINKYNLPYKFVGNGAFFIERKNPDFININGEKKAVEVYWDRHKEQFARGGLEGWKKERIKIFGKYGWEIIFIEGTGINEETILNKLEGGYQNF